jgi:subtilase family serine protease
MRIRFRRAAIVSIALSSIALSMVAGAVPATASPANPSPGTEQLCSTPQPGFWACFALRRTAPAGLSPNVVAGYGPADIASAYNLPAAGAGRTVAIVDAFDLPTAESDLATYRSNFGLPPCTTANGCFRKINQNGGTTPPASDAGWGGEIALDIDMVSAACPLCKILLVEAKNSSITNLGTAVNQAASQPGVVAISNSYGGPESSSDATFDTSFYKHSGIAVTASSGDSGFGTSYPAASPFVTSVGGTSLNPSANARGWTESVWNGSGSGCATSEAKPSFQVDPGCAHRTIADVSAVADPNTGVAVFDSFHNPGWSVFGGTSASSPIVASVFAMASPAAAGDFPVQYPYANPSALFDVVTGSNGSCSVVYLCTGSVGYDGPTGLGTPNGIAAFGPAPPTQDFSISASPTSATVNAGSGTSSTISTAVTLGAAQTVNLSASGLPSGVGATFTPSSVTAGASATLDVTTSASALSGTYPITITGTGTTATHTTTFTLTVIGTCASGQKLVNPGFESGATGWTGSAGVIGQHTGTAAPRTPTFDAAFDGVGATHTDTLSQTVTVPAGCTTYMLTLFLKVDTAETTTTTKVDKLTVKLGTKILATYSNLNHSTGYVQKKINVSSFAGQTVTLTFTGTENAALQTTFVIDDTALTVS